MTLFWWQSMVYPAHGESGVSTNTVQEAKVQNTSDSSSEFDLQGGKKLITIQHGETLSGIARKYQMTLAQIASLNQIYKPDRILAGQKLYVIAPEEQKPAMQNEGKEGNLFYLNYILAPAIEVRQEQTAQIEEQSLNTVEFFVNDVKTILLEPKTMTPDQAFDNAKLQDTSLKGNTLDSTVNQGDLSREKVEFTKEDIELLARVIYAEARGEDFEGQVAVGAVVINRLQDPRFPKTIRSVIYQQGAFTAVNDKQIHLTPDTVAYKAAEAALAGQDPTGGAIYYYNPKTATDRWIKSRPVIKTIGNHTFST
jgi:N-acetylmuramoyl-L-alanine amidase